MPGPETQSELGARLEKYYSSREAKTALAEWERDEVFMGLAATLWPVDFEAAAIHGYQAQSARQRFRLRHEGFRAVTNARDQIEGLRAAAKFALEKLDGK